MGKPTSEHCREIWEANKAQAAVLNFVVLGGHILGCSYRTYNNEAARGEKGLNSLQGRRE